MKLAYPDRSLLGDIDLDLTELRFTLLKPGDVYLSFLPSGLSLSLLPPAATILMMRGVRLCLLTTVAV